MEDDEVKLIVNANFIIDNEIDLTIKNIDINTLNKLNKDEIIKMLFFKWYVYGNYDKVVILDEEYTILNKTKKKVELVRTNKKADK
ncbi:hypothetical protein [Clostridium beijerinckii]|uniref:hypothetical protein n=1 Tax=Clostridium beijerinckii TaxID=1520 RepID=UPI00156EAB82|nr:hypothetical protein [Clostridium beijerinckii]NRU52521.1 hypothetical protein [Clostridium beijerinckii]NYC69400.1 hypothetical protein [Clostridium beijerinckii]NYC91722.1 hypothetical protein [Clostridium beijerinckii]